MKKYTFLFILLCQLANATVNDTLHKINPFTKYHVFLAEEDDECDACGCSASGGSMGFASMLNTNFIGVRYFNQSYKSSDGLYSNSPWYNEDYNTIQVWGRIPITDRIQVLAQIPYQFHNKDTKTGNQGISGIGDITVMALYKLYQTHRDSTFLTHTLLVGGGVNAPTGSFSEDNITGSINPSFQVGTGSWAYLFATEYVVKRKNIGLNAMLDYVLKTENKQYYRFGDQFNYALSIFYLYEKDVFSIAPHLGFAGEVYASNYQYGQELKDTAGDIIFGKLGFEVGRNKFSFGASAMLPINQNLTGGNVVANYRWSMNLNYSL